MLATNVKDPRATNQPAADFDGTVRRKQACQSIRNASIVFAAEH
jgi:hypothetical protein